MCSSLSTTVIELTSSSLFSGLHMSTACLMYCNQYDDIHYIHRHHLSIEIVIIMIHRHNHDRYYDFLKNRGLYLYCGLGQLLLFIGCFC